MKTLEIRAICLDKIGHFCITIGHFRLTETVFAGFCAFERPICSELQLHRGLFMETHGDGKYPFAGSLGPKGGKTHSREREQLNEAMDAQLPQLAWNPPAFSKASATRRRRASSKCLAKICMPTGRRGSLGVWPQGTLIPGMPARLAVTV